MPYSRRRNVVVVAVVCVVVVVVALVLVYVPLEAVAFQQTVQTSQECGNSAPCSAHNAVYTLVDDRYAVLTGTWSTNSSVEGVIVTINSGGSSQACSPCAGQLYSVSGAITGSFDVSGVGPFHFSVLPLHNGTESITFQGTITSAVL